MPTDEPAPKLTFKPVTKATWPDLEALFESKGGPGYCWCMPFRELAGRASATNADRKTALHGRVLARQPIGLVGYLKGEPVAWCSVGPRDSFTKALDGKGEAQEGVWSITCFFVRRDYRKSGFTAQLLEAAVKLAKKRGAERIEGYPVDPGSPSYRFMGYVKTFRAHGFKAAGKAGSRRHVMRREV